MNVEKLKRALAIIMLVVSGLCVGMYIGGFMDRIGSNKQLSFASAKNTTGVLAAGTVLRQEFVVTDHEIIRLAIQLTSDGAPKISFTLKQDESELLTGQVTAAGLDGFAELISLPLTVDATRPVLLELRAEEGNAEGVYWGDSVQLIRGETPLKGLNQSTALSINGVSVAGRLAANGTSRTLIDARLPFLLVASLVMALCIGWGLYEYRCFKQGKSTLSLRVINAIYRYWFVMSQMIERDFKAKYKRSILGVLWSFLNPLLTMTVQYIVFSTIFRSNIPYFPVYLMSGIVCFSFFGEATTVGLTSITGNAPLLTKVYIPKYIFPISRVLSSGINFLFSLIPLFVMVIISGLPFTNAYFLLPFTFICLLLLVVGIAMLLSTLMVFFRDVQFLWSVVTTLLTYMTPIFYPESILPEKLLLFIKFNPLYHVLRLLRSILIDGIAPEPKAFLLCAFACGVPFVIGVLVFKQQQDKFIVHL